MQQIIIRKFIFSVNTSRENGDLISHKNLTQTKKWHQKLHSKLQLIIAKFLAMCEAMLTVIIIRFDDPL